MAPTLQKAKNRRESGAFLAVPCSVLNSDNYKKLSAKGTKLLWDVASQIRMKYGGPINNGDLCITPKIMKDRGWNSRESLFTARNELTHYGFISETRKGGRNRASLYALTFFAIDECEGKPDVSATKVAANDWKQAKKKWQRPTRKPSSQSKKKLEPLYRFTSSTVPIFGTTGNNWNNSYQKVRVSEEQYAQF